MGVEPNEDFKNGSMQKQAAAVELIIASAILLLMIIIKGLEKTRFADKIPDIATNLMKEGSVGHVLVYMLLFTLVFSSAMSFFTTITP